MVSLFPTDVIDVVTVMAVMGDWIKNNRITYIYLLIFLITFSSHSKCLYNKGKLIELNVNKGATNTTNISEYILNKTKILFYLMQGDVPIKVQIPLLSDFVDE